MGFFSRASVFGLLLLAVNGVVVAQGAACPPTPKPFTPELFTAAAAQAKDRGFLWKITQGGHSSFLYGTMHVGKAEWMAPGPQVRLALQQTDMMGMELDPLDETVQQQLAAGTSGLARKLPAALQARLSRHWKVQCLPSPGPETQASEMQAFALSFMIGRSDGYDPTYGSEIMLSLIGRGLARPIVSLESVALQLNAMLAKDDAEASEMVRDVLDALDQGKLQQLLRKTAQIWEQGDLEAMERYAQWCECLDTESDRQLMNRLQEGRNPGLALRIAEIHGSGKRLFAAVGALHMVGPQGIPALLEKRGFRIERVR